MGIRFSSSIHRQREYVEQITVSAKSPRAYGGSASFRRRNLERMKWWNRNEAAERCRHRDAIRIDEFNREIH